MIIHFKLNKKIYKTKDSKKLTINEYINILNLIDDVENDIELSKKLLFQLTDIDLNTLNKLDELSLFVIDWLSYIKDISSIRTIKHKYNNLKLSDLDSLKFGKYIDLDYYLIQKDNDKIINVVALMLLPDDYTNKDFNNIVNIVKEMNISDILSIYNYFISYRLNIIKSFDNIFETEELDDELTEEELEEIEKNKSENQGWLNVAYMLTNKDITKVDTILNKNVLEIMNYLSWLKSENEKEIQRIKNI